MTRSDINLNSLNNNFLPQHFFYVFQICVATVIIRDVSSIDENVLIY